MHRINMIVIGYEDMNIVDNFLLENLCLSTEEGILLNNPSLEQI